MDSSRLRKVGMAVAGSLLVLGTVPTAFGDEGHSGLVVLGSKQTPDEAGVNLLNTGRQMLTGKLVVEVVIDGRSVLMQQRFTVSGGNKVFVKLHKPVRRSKIIRLGIIVDDGAPF